MLFDPHATTDPHRIVEQGQLGLLITTIRGVLHRVLRILRETAARESNWESDDTLRLYSCLLEIHDASGPLKNRFVANILLISSSSSGNNGEVNAEARREKDNIFSLAAKSKTLLGELTVGHDGKSLTPAELVCHNARLLVKELPTKVGEFIVMIESTINDLNINEEHLAFLPLRPSSDLEGRIL